MRYCVHRGKRCGDAREKTQLEVFIMFETEKFIEDCKRAVAEDDSHKAVREVIAEAVSDPNAIVKTLGMPTEAGFTPLYHSDGLTILNFAWAPLMTLMPHNHNMWAVIGIYSGREDNIFWRRTEDGIEAAGAKELCIKDAAPLGKDAVHSVTNPIEKITAALHVYGGDFFAPGRSEWDAETLEERPFDVERSRRLFREANERFAAVA
jgi:predicted metal-dependent enzyme (double-stranded beta helix superfamily)